MTVACRDLRITDRLKFADHSGACTGPISAKKQHRQKIDTTHPYLAPSYSYLHLSRGLEPARFALY